MYFAGATVAGNSSNANEDWTTMTSDLAVVLDGATVRTETGCKHDVAWYVRKLGASLIAEAASKSHPLREVLATAIQDVVNLHPECDLSHPGTPSAAVGMVRVENGFLRYVVLGDVSIVLDYHGKIEVVSDGRVSETAPEERRIADQYPIGAPEKNSALVKMKHAELAARNHDGGYWIAASNPDAANEAIVGEIEIESVRRFAILSDGAARSVDLFGLYDWTAALDVMENEGPDELIRQVRVTESGDPSGERFRRNKASDDATAVFATASSRTPKKAEAKITRITPRRKVTDEERRKAIADVLNSGPNLPGIMGGQVRKGWRTTD